jgi:hypothetical protein
MKICTKCDQSNSDTFKNCISCGHDLSNTKSDGQAPRIPDTESILNNNTHKDAGNPNELICGVTLSILLFIPMIIRLWRGDIFLAALYDTGAYPIIGYFLGRSIYKKFISQFVE